MFKNNKNGKILNILLSLIALFIIIFIIVWIIVKNNARANIEQSFIDNLNTMQEKAKKYFANDLPKNLNGTQTLSLKQMYSLGLLDTLEYNNVDCDSEKSYSTVSKISSNEYQVKSNLVCSTKEDYKIEKIKANTTVKDEDGNTIIDDEKDNVDLDINDDDNVTSSDGKKADTVQCTGPVCTFTMVKTNCTSTHENEFVKRSSTCPAGYDYDNGFCVKTTYEALPARKVYTDEKIITKTAIVNQGKTYKEYTNVIVTKDKDIPYCNEGTINGDKCILYKDKLKSTSYSCPTDYVENNGVCFKYSDMIYTKNEDCPTGYNRNGNLCYKYASLVTDRSEDCPTGYTRNGDACYKYADLIVNENCNCPSGYSPSGNTCVKSYSASVSYGSWGNPTYVKSSTQLSQYETATEKRVLVGTTKVGVTTIYNYATYTRSSYYSCPNGGEPSGSMCNIYAQKTCTSSTKCPTGYSSDGNTCYIRENLIVNTSDHCPSGYNRNGNTCYITESLIITVDSKCPIGYTRNNDLCYVRTSRITNTSYYCPTGYKETTNNKCYKLTNPEWTIGQTHYNCPTGYYKSGTGSNTMCYVVKKTANKYYCEDAKATLVGKNCKLTIPSEFKGYSCNTGYTLANDMCYKTSYDKTNLIWSNEEYIYSSVDYIDGYQKTGTQKYKITCVKAEIYK